MKEENKSICPFCESQIDVQKVTERINERIKENSEYSMIKKEFENNYNELQIEIKWWEDQVYKIKELNNQFNDEYIMHLCKLIENNIDCYKKSIPQNIEDVIIKHDIPKWDNSILRDTNYLIKKYSSKLLPSDVVSLLKKVIELRNDLEKIYNNVEMIDKKCNKKKIIDREYELINDFYEELICQRKRSVQGIYNEIKEDINKYYNTIHPDENIGDIELKVKDSASQGSALIEARFYEKKGEDPRAYYSESHLDTLGLAIFLALYKREYMKNKDLKFLVLDDVLTSVDASHRINIMNLIFTEFKEHQLIITTHDIVLFNEIIELEKQYGGKSKFKNIQIYEWTDKCGPQLDDTKSEFQKLIDYYSDSKTDGNILASYTGLFLELILRKLRYSLELAIPAKYYEKYTIADIWDNLYSKLKKNKEYYSKNSIVIDTINTHKFIRNSKGCHYNEWAQGISIDEIKMFTKNVIKFYETIYCSYCGTIIKKNNNDDYQCNCYKLIYKKDYKDSDS